MTNARYIIYSYIYRHDDALDDRQAHGHEHVAVEGPEVAHHAHPGGEQRRTAEHGPERDQDVVDCGLQCAVVVACVHAITLFCSHHTPQPLVLILNSNSPEKLPLTIPTDRDVVAQGNVVDQPEERHHH